MAPMTNPHSSSTKPQTVIADMAMSVDGFIATPDDQIDQLIGWYFAGDTEVAPGLPFRTSAGTAEMLRDVMSRLGAVVGGRRYFDLANGWGGAHPTGVPAFIVTHSVPEGWENAAPSITFVTEGGIEAAVALAKEAAGDKDVAIATPSTVRQCIDAGLLDEININIAPVLLGAGQRFFPGDDLETIGLSDPEVVVGIGVTHLRYRLAKTPAAVARG
jgi:dihydrofolate reductase